MAELEKLYVNLFWVEKYCYISDQEKKKKNNKNTFHLT